jgi:hypothetical protein
MLYDSGMERRFYFGILHDIRIQGHFMALVVFVYIFETVYQRHFGRTYRAYVVQCHDLLAYVGNVFRFRSILLASIVSFSWTDMRDTVLVLYGI